MHKRQYFGLLILVLALLLCACAGRNILSSSTTLPTYTEPIAETAGNPTEAPVPSHAPTEPPTEATEPTQEETEPTLPPHSDLYLPEYTAEQIFAYFEEVVLHVEYTDGVGNPSCVQKWTAPIHYRTFGKPTEEDLAVLEALFAQLLESMPLMKTNLWICSSSFWIRSLSVPNFRKSSMVKMPTVQRNSGIIPPPLRSTPQISVTAPILTKPPALPSWWRRSSIHWASPIPSCGKTALSTSTLMRT